MQVCQGAGNLQGSFPACIISAVNKGRSTRSAALLWSCEIVVGSTKAQKYLAHATHGPSRSCIQMIQMSAGQNSEFLLGEGI